MPVDKLLARELFDRAREALGKSGRVVSAASRASLVVELHSAVDDFVSAVNAGTQKSGRVISHASHQSLVAELAKRIDAWVEKVNGASEGMP